MFISERLVYLELHKTGSQHISHLLKKYCGDGTQHGYHNRLTKTLNNRFFIGSIRNPWEWYVSLWAYGCASKGGLRRQLTQKEWNLRNNLRWILFKPHQTLSSLHSNFSKPTEYWQSLYRDVDDPRLFQRWLVAILNSDRKFDIGEAYGYSSIYSIAGFLTFRYLKLYCHRPKDLFFRSYTTVEEIEDFDKKNNFLDYTIRNEELNIDFAKAITNAGYKLSQEELKAICSNERKNTSKHCEVSYYYNKKTVDLVFLKEKFIADKYNYYPPGL